MQSKLICTKFNLFEYLGYMIIFFLAILTLNISITCNFANLLNILYYIFILNKCCSNNKLHYIKNIIISRYKILYLVIFFYKFRTFIKLFLDVFICLSNFNIYYI